MPKSPSAKVAHGTEVYANDKPKNIKVSMTLEILEEEQGARHHIFMLRSLSNINRLMSCATKKALPDAMAIRGVEVAKDRITPKAKPNITTRVAERIPKWRLLISATKNVSG